MLTVHHLENSRSQRVLWLLEELDVPYVVKRYDRDAKTMLAPPELRRLHPLGKSPMIEEDGRVFAETGAIFERILSKHGEGRLSPPADTVEHDRNQYWLHYAEGSAMTPLLLKLVFSVMPARAPALMRPLVKGVADRAQAGFVDPQLKAHMDFWEGELAQREHFAGSEFGASDIMMSFPLEAAAARAGLAQDRPHAMAWLQRMHARPAYARALGRGGPYAYA